MDSTRVYKYEDDQAIGCHFRRWSIMKFITIFAAICVAAIYADTVPCPLLKEDKTKQVEVQKIYERINRPYRPITEPITARDVISPTTIKNIGNLPRNKTFSVFDETHWGEAEAILEELTTAKTFESFIRKSEAIRQITNEELFVFAFTTAVIHRRYVDGIEPIRIQDVFPDKFFTQNVISLIKEATNQEEKNVIVNEPFKYNNLMSVYNRLTYFTEDVGMNAHHFNWHATNPSIWTKKFGEPKRRRGEGFLYMHRQMLAKYDAERLSNYLRRTTPFEQWDDPILEGYASHLAVDRTGHDYAYRPDGMTLKDLPTLTKSQMLHDRNRIWDSIHAGFVIAENKSVIPINEDPLGSEVLGNLIESGRTSVNRVLYGNLHNNAHVIAARITDPYGKYEQPEGAMYDVITSARDPLFYRWHKFIDNLYSEYKNSLTAYRRAEVTWSEVTIESVEVTGEKSKKPNLITTFWESHSQRIGKFFSFTGQSTAEVRTTHLQHESFTYKFVLINNAGGNKEALFRVFLVPKYDEKDETMTFDELRPLMIEVDRFLKDLSPGKNTIERKSIESSISSPDKFAKTETKPTDSIKDDCSCHWPHYLLIPKGRCEGMTFRLVVAVTNWAEDSRNADSGCYCKAAPTFCRYGFDKDYDRRPYGYPFDRKIENVKCLDTLNIQNIVTQDITIKFTGEMMQV